jgi:hypothetical protein
MLEVRWLPPPFALLVITSFLLGSYNEYGISQFSLPTNYTGLFKPY